MVLTARPRTGRLIILACSLCGLIIATPAQAPAATTTTPPATTSTAAAPAATGATGGAAAPGGTPAPAPAAGTATGAAGSTPTAATKPATIPKGSAPSTAASGTTTPATSTAPATSTPAGSTGTPGAALPQSKSTSSKLSDGAIALAVLAALVLLGAIAWAIASMQAYEPRWTLSLRHAMAEAGYRASATWSELTEWARLSR